MWCNKDRDRLSCLGLGYHIQGTIFLFMIPFSICPFLLVAPVELFPKLNHHGGEGEKVLTVG